MVALCDLEKSVVSLLVNRDQRLENTCQYKFKHIHIRYLDPEWLTCVPGNGNRVPSSLIPTRVMQSLQRKQSSVRIL